MCRADRQQSKRDENQHAARRAANKPSVAFSIRLPENRKPRPRFTRPLYPCRGGARTAPPKGGGGRVPFCVPSCGGSGSGFGSSPPFFFGGSAMPTVKCPSCHAKGSVPASKVGKKLKCPKCGDVFVAGGDQEPALTVETVLTAEVVNQGETNGPSGARGRSSRAVSGRGPLILLCLAVAVALPVFICCGGLVMNAAKHPEGTSQETIGATAPVTKAASAPAAPTAKQKVRANRKLPRDEFRQLVTGMTSEQLIEAIGRPDSTQEIEGIGPIWYYNDVALDEFTGKMSTIVQIHWRAPGVVGEVNFD
jgi:predicted Zn finger-like uncharacterized protein